MGELPETVILCGGLGTRLRPLDLGVPKALVEVAGRPFLDWILQGLEVAGVGQVLLATGVGHDAVAARYRSRWNGLQIKYSQEATPLGTGGALRQALEIGGQVRAPDESTAREVFVMNGDTYFDMDLKQLLATHRSTGADVTIGVKPLEDIERYGTLELRDSRVVAFREKQHVPRGLINAGVYVVTQRLFETLPPLPPVFSFERDVLEAMLPKLHVESLVADGYFIDIGVPEDYSRACRDFLTASLFAGRRPHSTKGAAPR